MATLPITDRGAQENWSEPSSTGVPDGFSADLYLAANPDVAAAGMDAAEHYLLHGHLEGRALAPSDDSHRSESALRQLLEQQAQKFDVFGGVHPSDHLLSHLRGVMPDDETATQEYFSDGRESADRFARLVDQYPGTLNILEFASGYGRMTRHMRKVAPRLNMTVCDIHPEANQFVSEHMKIRSIPSTTDPDQFVADQLYDMTFALSLFSHLPDGSWLRWAKSLLATVKIGGFLCFTTHGRVTARNQGLTLEPGSILFRGISEQADIDLTQYGTSYVTAKYAFEQINSLGNARIVDFIEGHWWGHQDLYVVERTS